MIYLAFSGFGNLLDFFIFLFRKEQWQPIMAPLPAYNTAI